MIKTLLIVDDDIDVTGTFARVLKAAGFKCLVAHDSPAAFSLFDIHGPILVLSDINLPTGNGFEIARYVRQKSPNTRVILISGDPVTNGSGPAAGDCAARFLRKPFSNSELVSTIKSLLGG